MEFTNINKRLIAAALGVAFLGLAAGGAQAAPAFTINPLALNTAGAGLATSGVFCGLGLCATPFTATDIKDDTSALITVTSLTTVAETGWFNFGSFQNGSNSVLSTTSGLLQGGNPATGHPGIASFVGSYGLYGTFTSTSTLSGPLGTNQVDTITSFNYTVSADIGGDNTFVDATPAGVAPVVGGGTGNDVVLAVGALISGNDGFTTGSGGFTTFFNAQSTFGVCTGVAGQASFGGVLVGGTACGAFDARTYFASPVPFYDVSFDETNVTAQSSQLCVAVFPPCLAITSNGATLAVDFVVPEPRGLAVMGMGLLALAGLARMRRKQA